MNKKFYAVNKITGKRWEPSRNGLNTKEYLVMFDSGCFAVMSQVSYSGLHVTPLCMKTWKIVYPEKQGV